MNGTKILASYLSQLKYEDLPEDAIIQIKKAFLDWVGLTISGSREFPPAVLRKVLLADDWGHEATILCENEKGPCTLRKSALNAAFVNGAACHAQDFDDLHNASIIHLECVVVPPAFALAEEKKVSGRELMTAIAAGYELGGRVGESIQPDSYYFWHTTGTVGTLAAAASAARILQLDENQYLHALGSAGTQAAGLWDFVRQGAMSKPLHIGKACYGGVLSSLIAKDGYTGSTTILEGEKGFCRAMMKEPKWEKLTENLGKDFKIIHNSIKPWPCCKHSHSAIYGISELMRKNHLKPEEIRKITLHVNDITDSLINNEKPATPYGCKFSIQYCVSCMAAKGKVTIDDFREESIHDSSIQKIMEKVNVARDGKMTAIYNDHPDRLASRVDVEWGEWRKDFLFVPYPKGDPENPMTFEEIAEKGHNLVDSMIGKETYDRVVDLAAHLEDVKNMDDEFGMIF